MSDIFFLDPDYAEYKIGRKIKLETLYPYTITSRPKHGKRPLINLPYLLFLLLGFGSCVTIPSWFLGLSDHLERSALSGEAQAQVISCEESEGYRSGTTANLELTYDYPITNPSHSGQQRITTTAKQTCPETGALITIRYNPDNPRAVKVINPNDDTQLTQIMLLNLLCIVPFLILSIFYRPAPLQFTNMMQRSAINKAEEKIIRLKKHGQFLDGHILNCQLEKQGSTVLLTVIYQFLTPDGHELKGKQVRVRNDMRYFEPPPAGTPVRVLYADDKTHIIL